MARNVLVINCDIRETRVALIEDGVIAELQIERASAMGTVGNIVLGRVSRVLPGMQAAFIDVGMDRAAFLHVEDLIRPHDFEAYLAGGAREDHEATARGVGGRRPFGGGTTTASDDVTAVDADDDDAPLLGADDADDDDAPLLGADDADENGASGDAATGDAATGDEVASNGAEAPEATPVHREAARVPRRRIVGPRSEAARTEPSPPTDSPEPTSATPTTPEADPLLAASDGREGDLTPSAASSDDDPAAGADDEFDEDEASAADEISADEDDDEVEDDEALDEEGADVSGPTVPSGPGDDDEVATGTAKAAPGAPAAAPARDADDRSNRGRRRRRRGRKGAAPEPAARPREAAGKADRRHAHVAPSRVSRSVPITDVVKEGDEVVVQISKEPIGTKGARVTSHVSLPGRYVVYLPTLDHVGISKRIGSARERGRLREVMEALKPEKGGLIVRTVAEGLTKKGLKADVGYLIKLWADVSRRREGARAPTVLYTELDLVLKTARDLFTEEIEKIVIDDRDQYGRLVRFVEMFMPERVKDVELYTGSEPVFDAYGIEDEIGRALSRKVPLPSGGYLILDQAEALTAIDVNTGRYVGKGSKDLEETALKTNLEAVEEIAYQLRFRNIGGLVILDLIDMDSPGNRERVWRELERMLAKDKAKTTLNRISELGLIEMTRKRTRESLSRTMHEPCFYCDGTGQIASRTTIGYEILRQIRRERSSLKGYSVVVNAHPAIVDLMQGEERAAVEEAERRYLRRIEFNACREYHIEQFDLTGK